MTSMTRMNSVMSDIFDPNYSTESTCPIHASLLVLMLVQMLSNLKNSSLAAVEFFPMMSR